MKIILFIFYIFLVPLFSYSKSLQPAIQVVLLSNLINPPDRPLKKIITLREKKDSFPPEKELFQSLATYYEQKTAAELAEFQESTKGEWLKYIPSVGVTYTFDNKPRPTASLSTSTLYNAKKSKQAKAAKRKAILQINTLAHHQDKLKLQQLLRKYQLEQEALLFQQEIFEIDKTLFEIEEAKYNALEIAPSEFLVIKRAYLIKQFGLQERKKELGGLEGAILLVARML